MIQIPVWWQLLAVAMQAFGYWKAGSGWAWGWLLGLAINLSWAMFGIITHQYILLSGAVVFGLVSLRNYYKNRKVVDLTSYVTKDSGQREDFESGAVRDLREGKGRYDLISFLALHRIAGVYERGANKYDDRNWEKGMPIGRVLDSALRHIGQYLVGEADEDHLGQAAWNLVAALHFDEGIKRGFYPKELDDRPQYQRQPLEIPEGFTFTPIPSVDGKDAEPAQLPHDWKAYHKDIRYGTHHVGLPHEQTGDHFHRFGLLMPKWVEP